MNPLDPLSFGSSFGSSRQAAPGWSPPGISLQGDTIAGTDISCACHNGKTRRSRLLVGLGLVGVGALVYRHFR